MTEAWFYCPKCDGTGQYVCERCRRFDPSNRYSRLAICAQCNGTGEEDWTYITHECCKCGGTGRAPPSAPHTEARDPPSL
jgi:DnaJ-class molecular chaperone